MSMVRELLASLNPIFKLHDLLSSSSSKALFRSKTFMTCASDRSLSFLPYSAVPIIALIRFGTSLKCGVIFVLYPHCLGLGMVSLIGGTSSRWEYRLYANSTVRFFIAS